MATMHMFQKIRLEVSLGKSYSEIARKPGRHRSTIAKYAKSNTPPWPQDAGLCTRAPLGLCSYLVGMLTLTLVIPFSDTMSYSEVRCKFTGSYNSM